MKIGEYIILNSWSIRSPDYHFHGKIVGKSHNDINDKKIVEVLFPKGDRSNWYEENCIVISKQEYFKMRLS